MRLIVAGGRDYALGPDEFEWLDRLHERILVAEVVDGGATGADAGGRSWARSRGIAVTPFPAAWSDLDAPGAVVRTRADGTRYNARAGHDRNEAMAREADALAVFPGGSGTADMIRRAERHGLTIYRYKP